MKGEVVGKTYDGKATFIVKVSRQGVTMKSLGEARSRKYHMTKACISEECLFVCFTEVGRVVIWK